MSLRRTTTRSLTAVVGLSLALASGAGAAQIAPGAAAPAATVPATVAAPTEGAAAASSTEGSPEDGPTHQQQGLTPAVRAQSTLPQPSAHALETAPPTLTGTVGTPEGVTVVGLVWEGKPSTVDPVSGEAAGAVASMRVRQDGGWGPWQPLGEALPVGDDGSTWATDANVVVDAQDVQVELSGQVSQARVETWTNAVTSEDAARVAALPPVTGPGAGMPVGTRADWGANEAVRSAPELLSTPKLGVTLHHTVTAPVYRPEEVPATLRSIYAYHAQTLGWGDVGYNMFVDQHGRLWEGRAGGIERNVQGAHAVGMNSDWFGLSVIGDHETQPVAASQHPSITASAAWVMNVHGADVGRTLTYTNRTRGWTRSVPTLHGHRDIDATLCPGYHLFALMNDLRVKVAAEQTAQRTAVQRVGGVDRYAVAAQLARDSSLTGTRTAYLSQGDALADALGLAPVAASRDAAVLLTRKTSVPSATLQALRAMRVQEVVLVGGTTTIDPAVETQLRTAGYTVTRVGGDDRYAAAANVSRRHPAGTGGTVYLASGVALSDALGGAAAAAEVGAPLLLTRQLNLPGATTGRLRELAPSRVVVLGGPSTVDDAVLDQVRALLPGTTVDRIGGRDRYAVSAAVAQEAFDGATVAVMASGQAPADAMTGTQLAAERGGPVLLVRQACRPGVVTQTATALGVRLAVLSGGPTSIGWTAGSDTC